MTANVWLVVHRTRYDGNTILAVVETAALGEQVAAVWATSKGRVEPLEWERSDPENIRAVFRSPESGIGRARDELLTVDPWTVLDTILDYEED